MNMRQILTQQPAGWLATCGRKLRPRAPAKALQANAPSRVEDHLFQLEPEALENPRRAVAASDADPALGVHDPVPRNPAALIERAQGVADEARVAGQVRQPRDLSVSRHPPSRNAGHDRIDPLVARGALPGRANSKGLLHQSVGAGYWRRASSGVTRTSPPRSACATRIRSKGSRWRSGSLETWSAAASSMSRRSMPCASRARGTNRSGVSGSGKRPSRCLTAISQAEAALKYTSLAGSAKASRALAESSGA